MPVLFRTGMLPECFVSTSITEVDKISCSAHFLRSKRPLLLHFPTPSGPITPSQVWWPVPTLALKSPRRISLSLYGELQK